VARASGGAHLEQSPAAGRLIQLERLLEAGKVAARAEEKGVGLAAIAARHRDLVGGAGRSRGAADGVEPVVGDGFAFARIPISSDQLKTLPVGIADLYNATVIGWGMIMAAGMLVIVPGVTVFVCVQRHLVAGWGAGAVKG
jgi:hypothetical protein